MADIAVLTGLIAPEAQALGFDLVRVRMMGRGDERTLQVMAERPETRQLTIDDCAELSRRISDVLDREDPIPDAYRLEVSSPGIDRPLTRPGDFADWSGHEARIVLSAPIDGQKQFKGELAGLDGETIAIRQKSGTIAHIPFASVVDAKLVLTDKLIQATVPLSAEGAEEEIEAEETE
ncbi:ribosome maturation protein RimP [uncultured Sphingomonas sp.]|uniref:ribosome maturation protein RimP n=1 Tax=uncultured Sphingomonas sp. TaxID=158754 RepID=UPI0026354510|nr:ribosome maturation protein RimP [uncultured Sphingomonas sp.]